MKLNAPPPPNTLPNSQKNFKVDIQGEQLCKQGKWTDAIDLFKRALELGTNDPEIRTAVYSQVGNAYFYLKDYNAARGKFNFGEARFEL